MLLDSKKKKKKNHYYDFLSLSHAKRSMQPISEKLQAADVTKHSYTLKFAVIGLVYLYGSHLLLSRGHSVYLRIIHDSFSEHNHD